MSSYLPPATRTGMNFRFVLPASEISCYVSVLSNLVP
jgi:hypothetical protein